MKLDKLQESLNKFNTVFSEAGEADQDYDKEYYEAICDKLRRMGYRATHSEFDKYQGVFITVKGEGKDQNPAQTKIWHSADHEDEFDVEGGASFEYDDSKELIASAVKSAGVFPFAPDYKSKSLGTVRAALDRKMANSPNAKVMSMRSEAEAQGAEGIDSKEIKDKEDEIISILANSLVVAMSQVEEMMGEQFKDSKQAEAFLMRMLRIMQTSGRSDLRQVMRSFDRMGASFVRKYRRDLA